METRWPFGGFFFFLKIADEREGTHLYDDYQKELAEAPVTEDEEKEHRESAQAVLAELERLNIADEQRAKRRRRTEEGAGILRTAVHFRLDHSTWGLSSEQRFDGA